MASGLTSCHQALREWRNDAEFECACTCVSVLECTVHPYVHVCAYVCVWDTAETGNLFLVKSRSPHNKGPGRWSHNEENIIFLWPLWSAILTFHFQSSACWQKSAAPHLWWTERRNTALCLSSPPFSSSKKRKENEKKNACFTYHGW